MFTHKYASDLYEGSQIKIDDQILQVDSVDDDGPLVAILGYDLDSGEPFSLYLSPSTVLLTRSA